MKEGRNRGNLPSSPLIRLDTKVLLRLRAAAAKRHVLYQVLINDLLASETKKVD
jgi:hypothetical protein